MDDNTLDECANQHRPLVSGDVEAGNTTDGVHLSHHTPHSHRPRQQKALLISIVLTAAMMVVEFAASFMTGSLMLLSDSLHMLSHSFSLLISFGAILIAQKVTTEKWSFGLYRVEILAAFVNGIGLLAFSIWIMVEAVERLLAPKAVLGAEMTIVAVVGLLVNLTTALVLQRGGLEDLNTRSAFLHMLADTISSVVIIAGGIVIVFTGWFVIDPLLSAVVAVMTLRWSWGLLKESSFILLERGPEHLKANAVVEELKREFAEIKSVHDVHIWEITSQFVCLSAHVVTGDIRLSESSLLRDRISLYLKDRLGIVHVVLQFESSAC